jgi:diphosphomevalonate decarboxylase
MRSVATARANIALVKYWGKRDDAFNLPARGSLSLTLDALSTRTLVELHDGPEDTLFLDGTEQTGRPVQRISKFLDIIRAAVQTTVRARVTSVNAFPTAAGLASSASGFAALAVAASHAYALKLTPRELSILARRGSGSAARSIFGGFVKMGMEYAEPIERAQLELCAVIAVAKAKQKEIGSTDGMKHTAATSPYHLAWLDQVDLDLLRAERALIVGDFNTLADVTEGSCLAMHADAMAARPGILYFGPVTLWAISRVRALRAEGVPVFFTVDAGPHLVAFTTLEALPRVKQELEAHPEIAQVITARTGGPAAIEEESAR